MKRVLVCVSVMTYGALLDSAAGYGPTLGAHHSQTTEHGDPSDGSGPPRDLLERLKSRGLSFEDEAGLIRAVETRTVMPASAADALGWRPRSVASVKALRQLAESDNDGFALAAYRSLSKLGADGWQDEACARFLKMDHLMFRLDLASILARSGRYEGWSFVRDTILRAKDSKSSEFFEALIASHYFREMKDKDGRPGAAIRELRELNFRAATGETKNALADWLRRYDGPPASVQQQR